jgi:hypothetical protein
MRLEARTVFECHEITEQELWLNSPTAVALSKRKPAPGAVGIDGW